MREYPYCSTILSGRLFINSLDTGYCIRKRDHYECAYISACRYKYMYMTLCVDIDYDIEGSAQKIVDVR